MEKDPEILVPLTSTRTAFEAETIAQALNAHGVPAQVFGLAAQVLQWELGYHDAIKVMVRRGDLETAKDVLKAIKADSVDIDWSEVDVGTPEQGFEEAPKGESRAGRRVWAVGIFLGLGILGLLAYAIAGLF